jgi:hypothetical protein
MKIKIFFLKINFYLLNFFKINLNYIKRKITREVGNEMFNLFFNINKYLISSGKYSKILTENKCPKSLLIQWNEILKNSKTFFIKTKYKEKIFFAPIYGFSEIDLAIASIFGKFFQLKGYDVSVLFCGAAMPCCAWNINGNGTLDDHYTPQMFSSDKIKRCKSCYNEIFELFPFLNIKLKSLEKLTESSDLSIAQEFVDKNFDRENIRKKIYYNDIEVSEHAYSTTLRKLLIGNLINDEYSFSIYRRYLISAILYVRLLEKFFIKEKPNKIIFNHGIYLEHGVLVDFCKKKNIHAIIYGFPYRKNCIMASHFDTYHRDLISEPTSRWDQLKLNENNLKELDLYMKSKVAGGKDNVNYHPKPIIYKEEIFQKLKIQAGEEYDCLLTNTIWDAQIFYEGNIFSNMLEWIYETIDYYLTLSKRKLVIRIHPGESKGLYTTNQPIYNEILKKFPNLNNNIIIVKPESDISTYTLIENSNMVLIYGTNAGLEVAYRGIPLIICGEATSRGKGLGYEVKDKESYFKILRIGKIKGYDNQLVRERAKKYCYHLFFKRWHDTASLFSYAFMRTKEVNLEFKNLLELENNSFLNKFEHKMINKLPFEF